MNVLRLTKNNIKSKVADNPKERELRQPSGGKNQAGERYGARFASAT